MDTHNNISSTISPKEIELHTVNENNASNINISHEIQSTGQSPDSSIPSIQDNCNNGQHQWNEVPFHTECILTPRACDIIKINFYKCEQCHLGTWSNWSNSNESIVPTPSYEIKSDRPSLPWDNYLRFYPAESIPNTATYTRINGTK